MGSRVSSVPCRVMRGLPIFPVSDAFFTAFLTAAALSL